MATMQNLTTGAPVVLAPKEFSSTNEECTAIISRSLSYGRRSRSGVLESHSPMIVPVTDEVLSPELDLDSMCSFLNSSRREEVHNLLASYGEEVHNLLGGPNVTTRNAVEPLSVWHDASKKYCTPVASATSVCEQLALRADVSPSMNGFAGTEAHGLPPVPREVLFSSLISQSMNILFELASKPEAQNMMLSRNRVPALAWQNDEANGGALALHSDSICEQSHHLADVNQWIVVSVCGIGDVVANDDFCFQCNDVWTCFGNVLLVKRRKQLILCRHPCFSQMVNVQCMSNGLQVELVDSRCAPAEWNVPITQEQACMDVLAGCLHFMITSASKLIAGIIQPTTKHEYTPFVMWQTACPKTNLWAQTCATSMWDLVLNDGEKIMAPAQDSCPCLIRSTSGYTRAPLVLSDSDVVSTATTMDIAPKASSSAADAVVRLPAATFEPSVGFVSHPTGTQNIPMSLPPFCNATPPALLALEAGEPDEESQTIAEAIPVDKTSLVKQTEALAAAPAAALEARVWRTAVSWWAQESQSEEDVEAPGSYAQPHTPQRKASSSNARPLTPKSNRPLTPQSRSRHTYRMDVGEVNERRTQRESSLVREYEALGATFCDIGSEMGSAPTNAHSSESSLRRGSSTTERENSLARSYDALDSFKVPADLPPLSHLPPLSGKSRSFARHRQTMSAASAMGVGLSEDDAINKRFGGTHSARRGAVSSPSLTSSQSLRQGPVNSKSHLSTKHPVNGATSSPSMASSHSLRLGTADLKSHVSPIQPVRGAASSSSLTSSVQLRQGCVDWKSRESPQQLVHGAASSPSLSRSRSLTKGKASPTAVELDLDVIAASTIGQTPASKATPGSSKWEAFSLPTSKLPPLAPHKKAAKAAAWNVPLTRSISTGMLH